jgi:SAM-dependent methyltransferase
VYPGFVDEVTQRTYSGCFGEQALIEADRFRRFVLQECAAAGLSVNANSKLVDFGAGWGRITRQFLHDIEASNITGVDPDHAMIERCKKTFEPLAVNFVGINNHPPLPFADESIDVITAYSVFSHLPEDLATSWMNEFKRVLKPGGVVIVTVQGREFLSYVDRLRNEPGFADPDFAWHNLLKEAWTDIDATYKAYDDGEYLYSANGGGYPEYGVVYGDALIPEGYVRSKWSSILECVLFEQPGRLSQGVTVLRKSS